MVLLSPFDCFESKSDNGSGTCMKWSARKSGVILKIIQASETLLLNSKNQTLTARQTGVNPLIFRRNMQINRMSGIIFKQRFNKMTGVIS